MADNADCQKALQLVVEILAIELKGISALAHQARFQLNPRQVRETLDSFFPFPFRLTRHRFRLLTIDLPNQADCFQDD